MKKLMMLLMVLCCVSFGVAGDLVPGFNDATALVDYTAPTPSDAVSDFADNAASGGQITLAARFTPTGEDIDNSFTGPVFILEVGGTSFGQGLYIAAGNLVYGTKGSNGASGNNKYPASTHDLDASDAAAVATVGPLTAGIPTVVIASFDANTGQLNAAINEVTYQYTFTGTVGTSNLTGNESVTFLGDGTLNAGNCGGIERGANMLIDVLNSDNAKSMVGKDHPVRGQIFAAFFSDLDALKQQPNTPSPANLDTGVETGTALSFYTAEDPANAGSQDPAVTGHWVTVYELDELGEPNMATPLSVSSLIPTGTDPITYSYGFTEDDVVFWQVEEQVSNKGKGDPNNIVGPVWKFEAVLSVPVVTGSPVNAIVEAGNPASFDCVFTSKSDPTAIEWYRASDPENPIDDADADITIGLIQDGYTYTSTLTIDNVEIADQDDHYCYVANGSGEDTSDSAALGVKRLIAYWTMDKADYVGGLYLDSGTEDPNLYPADPNRAPNINEPTQWVEGVDGTADGALNLTLDPLVAARTEPFAAAAYTDEITVSVWVNWAGTLLGGGAWQGLVCSNEPVNNWFFELDNANGYISANAPGYDAFNSNGAATLTVGKWQHLVLTATAGEVGTIYLDGLEVASSDLYSIDQNESLVILGASGVLADGVLRDSFNGSIDEIKIYNYAKTPEEVAQMYYDISNVPVCLNPDNYDLTYDVAGGPLDNEGNPTGDCIINLADFAELAADWLECGLYPQTACGN